MPRTPEPDEQQFSALVHEHAARMYRLAYAVLRNGADAEDAVQDTLLQMYRTGAWKRADNAKAFLARAAWRSALARARLRTRQGEEPLDAAPVLLQSQAISAEQNRDEARALARLQMLIDTLPEKYRSPLLLLSMREMTSAEAAEMLQIPDGTVRRRAMQARTMLRERYTARYGRPS